MHSFFFPLVRIKSVINVNSVDPDQTPHSVASDLGLYCFQVTILGVSLLKWLIHVPWVQITKLLTRLYSHCCILFIAMYWFYFPVNSGFLCAKGKVPDLTVHFCILLIVMQLLYWAIYYVATHVLENTLTRTLCINQYWFTHSRTAEFSPNSLDTH